MSWCDNKCTIMAFTAKAWCGPCIAMKDALKKIEQANGIRFHFKQFDDDDMPAFVSKKTNELVKTKQIFGVNSYPTLIVFNPKIDKYFLYKPNTNSTYNYRSAEDIFEFAKKVCELTKVTYMNSGFEVFPTPNYDFGPLAKHNGNCHLI